MKKTITIALLTAAVIGATSFFSSCSIKNDDDSDWIIDRRPDPVTIDLSKVFTNGTPKEVDSMTIQTDERGLVTSIKTKDETVSFKYFNTKTRAIVIPNVVMKVERNGKATVYIMYLNNNGFVRRCVIEQKENTKEDIWRFTYNDNDQLINIIHSADDYKEFTLTYKDSNISEIETKTIVSKTTTRKKDTYKVAYTSDTTPTPIVNKGRGLVTSIKTKDETVSFKYFNTKTRAIVIPNVVMKVERNGKATVYIMYLNNNGFVRRCVIEQKENTKEDIWRFTYNDNDQLINIIHSADDYKEFTLTYKDSNISEIETKTIVSKTTTRKKDTYKVAYTSDTTPTPIVNKGNIMLFNTTFGIDIGAMKYAYYAGLLGKATKNLPVQLIDKNGNKNTFTWIVNSNGFPTAMTSGSHQYKFGW